jgi:hypothetical protein
MSHVQTVLELNLAWTEAKKESVAAEAEAKGAEAAAEAAVSVAEAARAKARTSAAKLLVAAAAAMVAAEAAAAVAPRMATDGGSGEVPEQDREITIFNEERAAAAAEDRDWDAKNRDWDWEAKIGQATVDDTVRAWV